MPLGEFLNRGHIFGVGRIILLVFFVRNRTYLRIRLQHRTGSRKRISWPDPNGDFEAFVWGRRSKHGRIGQGDFLTSFYRNFFLSGHNSDPFVYFLEILS